MMIFGYIGLNKIYENESHLFLFTFLNLDIGNFKIIDVMHMSVGQHSSRTGIGKRHVFVWPTS